MALLYFNVEPPISIAKIQKLSENQEYLAENLTESGYFPLFSPKIEQNIRENYKFASKYNNL